MSGAENLARLLIWGVAMFMWAVPVADGAMRTWEGIHFGWAFDVACWHVAALSIVLWYAASWAVDGAAEALRDWRR